MSIQTALTNLAKSKEDFIKSLTGAKSEKVLKMRAQMDGHNHVFDLDEVCKALNVSMEFIDQTISNTKP